jgi:hypothetical protein
VEDKGWEGVCLKEDAGCNHCLGMDGRGCVD